MQGLVDAALSDPWATLDAVLDGPLHPGGRAATARLLDRAAVGRATRLLDVGCGAGTALAQARGRGARAVGLDRDPPAGGLRGDLERLPVAADAVDVVLAECVYCLADDRGRALREARRVLGAGGRLALSDVVVEGDLPGVPPRVRRAFCLDGAPSRGETVAALERAGFAVGEVRDHRDELLAMRDELAAAVDYEGLLAAMGERGDRLRAAADALETAVAAERVGYVSTVATVA